MKFTPKYTVSYNGVFHKAGVSFDIDPKDRTEMERHGKVVEDKPTTLTETPATEDKPARKGGRPRKVSA